MQRRTLTMVRMMITTLMLIVSCLLALLPPDHSVMAMIDTNSIVTYSEPNFSGTTNSYSCCMRHQLHIASTHGHHGGGTPIISSVAVPHGLRAIFFVSPTCTGSMEERIVLNSHTRDIGVISSGHNEMRLFGCVIVERESGPSSASSHGHPQHTHHHQHHNGHTATTAAIPRSHNEGVSLYEDSQWRGATMNVPMNGAPVVIPDTFGVSSVRVTPGLVLILYASPSCEGHHVRIYRDVMDLVVLSFNDVARCGKAEHVDTTHGVFLYSLPGYQGEAQFVPVGSQNEVMYNDQTSSIRVPNGISVMLYEHPQLQGRSLNLISDTPDLRVLSYDDLVSSLMVTVICRNGCGHGTCISHTPEKCQCEDGWYGDRCDEEAVDATSAVVCDQSNYLVGESAQCRVLLRNQGKSVYSSLLAIAIDATPVTVDANYGDVILPSASIDGDGSDAPVAGRELPFKFVCQHSTPRVPVRVFSVRIFTPGQGFLSIFVPNLRIFDVPDASSIVTCPRTQVMIGEPMTCTIMARNKDLPIDTLMRSFTVQCGSLGLVTPLKSQALSKEFATLEVAATWKLKKYRRPVDAAMVFEFRYTATSFGFGASESTAELSVTLRNGAHTTMLSAPRLEHVNPSSTDWYARGKHAFYAGRYRTAVDYLTNAIRRQASVSLDKSLLLRGQLYVLLGNFTAASQDYNAVMRRHDPKSPELVASGIKTKRRILKQVLEHQQRGIMAHALGNYGQSADHLSQALEIAMESDFLHLLRADCGLKLDHYQMVRFDTSRVLAYDPTHRKALLLLAAATYKILGRPDAALQNLRVCLAAEPDHIECNAQYTKLKAVSDALSRAQALEKSGENLTMAAISYQHVITNEPKGPLVRGIHVRLCTIWRTLQDVSKCTASCTHALVGVDTSLATLRNELVGIYLNRAWSLLQMKKYDLALSDIARANEIDNRDARIEDLRQEILTAKAGTPKKNYYEILGVERTASAAEIKRAYRKLALIWHPDKNHEPGAEEMFIMINEAFGVLGDETLRQRYDGGESQESIQKPQPPPSYKFNFNPNEADEDGNVRAWFTNHDGEKEFTELNIDPKKKQARDDAERERRQRDEEERRKNAPMPQHCCLPE